jgi:hypothetical protein
MVADRSAVPVPNEAYANLWLQWSRTVFTFNLDCFIRLNDWPYYIYLTQSIMLKNM